MDSKSNPFRFGGDLGADELVDRVEETALVESTIRNGEKLFLIGPRRFGKTSILRSADENLTAVGAVVLRLDAEAYPTIDMLVSKMVTAAATRLKGKLDLGIEQISRFFSRLKPEIKYGGVEQDLSVSIGVDSSAEENRPVKLFVDALDGLEALAFSQPGSRPVGLIIDEFQAVVARGGIEAEAQIRAAIQGHRRVGYVFAGSQTRIMTDMTMRHERPLYRLGTNRFIGPLPADEFSAHLLKHFRRGGFVVSNAVPVQSILDLAEEVPFNVQMLAHNCWEELRSKGGSKQPKLTVQLVEAALRRTVNGLDPWYTESWTRLTTVQQKTLLAVIRREGTGMSSSEAARSLGLAVSSLQSAIRGLQDQNILRDDPATGRIRLRFVDPFFSHWIKMVVIR